MSDEQNNVIELKPSKRGKKRWLLFGAILLVVLALLVWFLLSKSTALDGVKRWFRYLGRDTEAFGSFTFESYGTTDYALCNDRLVVGTQSGLTVFSEGGTALGRVQKSLSSPAVQAAKNTVLGYDIGGTLFSILDDNGAVVQQQTTAGSIFDADIAGSGTAAVLYSGTDCRAVLEVYQSSGDILYRVRSKSHFFNACAVNSGGTYAAVAALGERDVTFDSSVRFYNTQREGIAAEVSLGERTVYDMTFLDSDTLFVLCDDSAFYLSTDGMLLAQYSFEGGTICDFCADGSDFVVLTLDSYQTDRRYRVVTLDRSGEELGSVNYETQPRNVSACASYVAVLTAEDLKVYDRDLKFHHGTDNAEGYTHALVRSDGTALLIGSGVVQLYIP